MREENFRQDSRNNDRRDSDRHSSRGNSYGGNTDRRGSNRFEGRSSDRPPVQKHPATCSDCGKECKVPFKPSQDRPVFCNDCFPKHKPKRDNY